MGFCNLVLFGLFCLKMQKYEYPAVGYIIEWLRTQAVLLNVYSSVTPHCDCKSF